MPKPAQQVGRYGLATGILAVVAGIVALWFATCHQHFAALVALALSAGWSVMSAVSVVSASNARRVQAEMRRDAVDKVIRELVTELKIKEDASQRAELVDRLHALASTALTKP